jgi:glycosyltransferase involved in cell wall biosynthesis
MTKVFVLAGYQHFAAGRLLYEIGRLLDRHFGYEPIVIRLAEESPDNSVFSYLQRYPTIELKDLAGAVQPDDLMLPLASFADLLFGLELRCRKLLYVQGMNTFKVLDGFMDGYVAVSGFVRQFLHNAYGLEAPVIHPFVEFASFAEPAAWSDRDPTLVVVYTKAPVPVKPLVDALLARLGARHPGLPVRFHLVQRGIPHVDLMAQLARTRYVVALSPLEGFGLFPLEAMASGCAVVGFHGGGGLDYMTEQNSRVVSYPRLDDVVDQLAAVVRDQALAQALAAQGRVDARQFTRERFEAAWIDYLRGFLAR